MGNRRIECNNTHDIDAVRTVSLRSGKSYVPADGREEAAMDRILAVARCKDSRLLFPLSLPHRVPAESQLDLTWTGAASICEGRWLRPQRGEVCNYLCRLYHPGPNCETKRYLISSNFLLLTFFQITTCVLFNLDELKLDPFHDHWRKAKVGQCDVYIYSAFLDNRREDVDACIKVSVAVPNTYKTRCAKDAR